MTSKETMSNIFTVFFSKIGHWFSGSRGQAVLHGILSAAIEAEPLVESIAAATSNRTFASINSVYQTYAIPLAKTEEQLADPEEKAIALRDLAVKKLRENHQEANANILNAAVEIALAHVKSKETPVSQGMP
jgi:hypothetical protein